MRSQRFLLCVLVAGVGVGVLMTGPVCAQSVSLGNGLIDVLDAQGDTAFHVDSSSVDIGATGADVDLFMRETSTGAQALYFNTSLGTLIVGGTDSGGEILLRDTTNFTTLQANSAGDLILGSSTSDGDITVKESSTNRTNFSVDGDTATVTVGAHGALGDAGQIYIRDDDGVSNNLWLRGNFADFNMGSTVSGQDGDISLSNGTSSSVALDLEGSSGSISNIITGNGVVKAWAQINADGTVNSCHRCNASITQTNNISTGTYEVDFVISTDISARPVVCSAGITASLGTSAYQINCVGRSGDPSSIFVITKTALGINTNSSFTAVVF